MVGGVGLERGVSSVGGERLLGLLFSELLYVLYVVAFGGSCQVGLFLGTKSMGAPLGSGNPITSGSYSEV